MDNEMDSVLGAKVALELKNIEKSVQDTHGKIKSTQERQDQEIKELGGVSAESKAAMAKLEARYDQERAELKGTQEQLAAKFEELTQSLATMEEKRADELARRASGGRKNMASAFEAEAAWKNWNPESNMNSPKVYLGRIDEYKARDSKNLATGSGAVLDSVLGITNWQSIYGEPVIEDQHLRAYMNVETATGASVAYVRRTIFDNGADFQTAQGELKPESEHTFISASAEACVLAHLANISKQQARSTSTVVNYIQNDLLRGLFHVESQKILFSDGGPGAFLGITNTPGIQSYVRGVSGDTPIDALRRSETQLQGIYMRGDLYVVNHEDWEGIELQKDAELRYIWVSVQDGGTERMWRKPVFVTPAMAQGRFINGAFRTAATLLDFEQASIQMFAQHKDHVARNLLTILAEETIGLAVTVPAGFVVGQYDSIGSGS